MKSKAARKTAHIHAVVGSDESAVKTAAAELAAQLTPPDAGDFGVEIDRRLRRQRRPGGDPDSFRD